MTSTLILITICYFYVHIHDDIIDIDTFYTYTCNV